MYGDGNQYYYGSEHSGPEGGFGMNAHGPTQGDGMREIGVNCIHDGYSFHDGVSSICFDIVEESVWTGSVRGSLYQHVGPSLEYYSCVNTASFHDDGASYGDSITHMKSLGHSIVSISAGQFNMHMSGGSARVCYLDGLGDMGDFMYQHWNHKVIIGRHGGGVFTYDVMRGSVGASYDTHHGVVALAGPMGSGQIAMASPEGYLTMFDPRQAKISGHGCMSESKLYAHGFASMESSGHLIATAGYSGLADRPVLEPMIKLFDSRMGVKQLSSIPFSNGPSLLKFHPTLKSTLLACSASGIFGMMDTSGAVSSHTDTYFIDMQGDTVSSCDISSNGDCIVFGGANGYIHLWSTLSQPVFVSGIMPDYASPLDSSTIHSMDENSSFALAPLYMSPDGEQYASYVEENETMSVGLPSRVVDASLLQIGKQSEFVTYIENPKYNENNQIGTSAASVSSMRNKRIRHRRTGKETEAAIHERAQRREKEGGVVLPRKFGKISIRQQKGSRFEEFDFKVHNTTPFSGLENGIANCYMNALIQILYFCRPLRDFALRCPPDPEKEFSLLGEISLLFHMLASSQGEVCQASNLLRALRQTSEAVALGLLEGVKGERGSVDIAVEAQKDKSLVRRIERLCRFFITRLDKEEQEFSLQGKRTGNMIQDIFCMRQRQLTTCLTHDLPGKEQTISTFQLELKYASGVQEKNIFSSILSSSLQTSSELKAWFDENVKYQPVRQERCPIRLPTVLVTYTGLDDQTRVDFWNCMDATSFPFAISVTYDIETGNTCVEQGQSLPSLTRKLDATPTGSQRDVYLLTGVVSYVNDKDEAEEIGKSYEGHLISHVNVPKSYYSSEELTGTMEQAGDTSGALGMKWMTFNDFAISACSLEEIYKTYDEQKSPVLLFFTKVSYLEDMDGQKLDGGVQVLDQEKFVQLCNAPPIHAISTSTQTFIPLSSLEKPQKGDLFALDAEFVAYSAPEKMILSDPDDWARTSRLGLGRVSLIRGSGPSAGVPCIDDYIRSVEPVYDHLTRYSGLLPGDLDIEHSKKHLTTLRKAYLKLRYLVDSRCLFVGHGLKKDFRMLNIVVPPDQTIDTMDLYYSGRGRRLSLKFLSSFFLRSSIQGDTHDSIEDATAALELFRLYEKMVKEGCFEEMLQKAYDWGTMAGWDPSTWADKPPEDFLSLP